MFWLNQFQGTQHYWIYIYIYLEHGHTGDKSCTNQTHMNRLDCRRLLQAWCACPLPVSALEWVPWHEVVACSAIMQALKLQPKLSTCEQRIMLTFIS